MTKPIVATPLDVHGMPARIQMEDVGAQLLQAMANLHVEYFSQPASVWGPLRLAALAFLDASHADHDALNAYANNFSVTAMRLVQQGNALGALRVWERALEPVYEWEAAHPGQRVHKASLFYYAGGTAVLTGDFDLGFLYLHKAVAEDRLSGHPNPTDLPAWKFVALEEESPDTLWHPVIRRVGDFVRARLDAYRVQCGTNLTLAELRTRFLRNAALENQAFFFVRTLFRLSRELSLRSEILDPVFAPLHRVGLLANVYLVTEELLRAKAPPGGGTMAGLITGFSVTHGHSVHLADPVQTPRTRLEVVKDGFTAAPDATLTALADGTYAGTPLSRPEMALAISPPLRNFGAHRIESRPCLIQSFDAIVQLALNATFYVVERAYP